MNRRRVISGFAAGLGSLAYSRAGVAMSIFVGRPPVSKLNLIDVHHHFVPPFYVSENRDRIAAAGGGWINPAFLSWTPERSLSEMDKYGVAMAVLSLTSPGVWFGDAPAAASTAHRANEYAADLVQRYRGRFRFFAAIPLPDAESSLRET